MDRWPGIGLALPELGGDGVKNVLLWLIGVPISVLIVLNVFGIL